MPQAAEVAQGRTLRFLANVDPVDVARATQGLDPEETLVRLLYLYFFKFLILIYCYGTNLCVLGGAVRGASRAC